MQPKLIFANAMLAMLAILFCPQPVSTMPVLADPVHADQPITRQVTIQGASEARPGDLVVLVPVNIEETRVIWNLNYPETFEQFTYENNKLFLAMPNRTISFSLLVIPNDTSRPIQNLRHTIVPRDGPDEPGNPTDPPVEEPGDEPTPGPDPKTSPLYAVTKQAYDLITAPDKTKWAGQMEDAFSLIAQQTEDGEFSDIESMILAVGKANRGETEGFEPWPEDNRKLWNVFRASIASSLDTLKDSGKLETTKDYVLHWRAIAAGLADSRKGS